MNRSTRRRLALPVLALTGALVLAACGEGQDAAGGASSGGHGSGHSTGTSKDSSKDSSKEGSEANDADLAFLTGMTPHHEQAVAMSDLVLAADPPAAVAAIARRIKAEQAPEIEQMQAMLRTLGQEAGGEHGSEHGGGHAGMLSEQELAALDAATGTEAARLYLEGMVKHHEGAIEASETELADGTYEPARTLAQEIKAAQQQEIIEMQALLKTL